MHTTGYSRRGKAAFTLMLLLLAALFVCLDFALNDTPLLTRLFSQTAGVDADGYYTEYDARIGTALIALNMQSPEADETSHKAEDVQAGASDGGASIRAPIKPLKPIAR